MGVFTAVAVTHGTRARVELRALNLPLPRNSPFPPYNTHTPLPPHLHLTDRAAVLITSRAHPRPGRFIPGTARRNRRGESAMFC